MSQIPTKGTIITDGATGDTYQIPFIEVNEAQAVDFQLLFGVCGIFIFLYLVLLFLAKRSLIEHIKDVVILIFNLYGISVCVNVIDKAWKFVWQFEFVHSVGEGDKFVIPQMSVDELVLIFIGSVAVGLILIDQVVAIMQDPIQSYFKNRNSKPDPSPSITAMNTHSSTPPKATDVPPSP